MLTLVPSTSQVQKKQNIRVVIWNQLRGKCNLSALDKPVDLGQSSTIMKHAGPL